MVLNEELLEILVCPETKQKLCPGDSELVMRINQRIQASELRNRAGEAVSEPVDGVLVREDGLYAYVVRDQIPVMLVDESLEIATV